MAKEREEPRAAERREAKTRVERETRGERERHVARESVRESTRAQATWRRVCPLYRAHERSRRGERVE